MSTDELGSGDRVLVVSHMSEFGTGGASGFIDILCALRAKRPDLQLIAAIPGKGSLAEECSRRGVRTATSWTPWWTTNRPEWTAKKWARPVFAVQSVIGAVTYSLVLMPSVAVAVAALRRARPAAVLTNTMPIPSYAIAAKLLGIPHYWVIREFGREDHGFWFVYGYRTTIRLIGRMSKMVICNSRAVETAMLTQVPAMKTAVVYPAVESPLGEPRQRHPGEPLRAVLVGALYRAKGQDLAIEAVAVARRLGVDVQLTLVGAGNRRPFRMLARRLGVEDLVSVHGPTRDLAPHWSAAHVGLMCSHSEAFGRVTVEAMRAGLPVCGTDSGGTSEIIEAGVNGLLSQAGDAEMLAANLMALESDEELRWQLAAGAIASARRFERKRHNDDFAAALGLKSNSSGIELEEG